MKINTKKDIMMNLYIDFFFRLEDKMIWTHLRISNLSGDGQYVFIERADFLKY